MRRKLKKKAGSSPKRSNGKSSSLTDLTTQKSIKSKDGISSRHSTSDLSPRGFEKSSSSSTGTVVPQKMLHFDEEIDPRILEALNTDPSSLPVELYSVMNQAVQNDLKRNQQSQTSLNSKQSVETVISLEQLMARHANKKSNERFRSKRVPESDSLDTDDEVQMLKQSSYFPRNDAEGSEANSDPQPPRPAPLQDQSWVRHFKCTCLLRSLFLTYTVSQCKLYNFKSKSHGENSIVHLKNSDLYNLLVLKFITKYYFFFQNFHF